MGLLDRTYKLDLSPVSELPQVRSRTSSEALNTTTHITLIPTTYIRHHCHKAMQGDIFELESARKSAAPKHVTFQTKPKPSAKLLPEQSTLIYNEDDLSHLIHQPESSLHDHHLYIHDYKDTVANSHYLELLASAFDDYCTDDVLEFSDDSAACSDDEFDLPSPVGEKTECGVPASLVPKSAPVLVEENEKTIPETSHVSAIEGQIMSWWPLPLEKQEYDFGYKVTSEAKPVPPKPTHPTKRDEDELKDYRHVSSIEGQLMSWWPMPTELIDCWNEKYYE
jgi:hypothetical protein